jgi:hypothetical protein
VESCEVDVDMTGRQVFFMHVSYMQWRPVLGHREECNVWMVCLEEGQRL